VLAAVGYTFFMTIAILNFMKFTVFACKKNHSSNTNLRVATGYYKRDRNGNYEMDPVGRPDENSAEQFRIHVFVDNLQPTPPQRWIDDPLLRRSSVLPLANGAPVPGAHAQPPVPGDAPADNHAEDAQA